jgi:hypothetical protein
VPRGHHDHDTAIARGGDQIAIATIQQQIALGGEDDGLDHLGEASSIHLLAVATKGRLISDDHGARAVARRRRTAGRRGSPTRPVPGVDKKPLNGSEPEPPGAGWLRRARARR